MILYQTEWCPYSHRVRQRLTELGLEYTVRQVPAERSERAELVAATGQNRIPVLVPGGGPPICGSPTILSYLAERFGERPDAGKHRAKAAEKSRASRSSRLEAASGRSRCARRRPAWA